MVNYILNFSLQYIFIIFKKIEYWIFGIVCIIPSKMNTNAKDIRIYFGGEVRKTSEDDKLSYMLQKAKYLGIPFQIEEDEKQEKAIAYHPYVIKIFEDTKKTFENNPIFPSHYECSFSLASIGKIDGLLVDTSLIFRRFFHGEQKITPSFNARMVVDCSKIVVNNYV